MTEIYQRKFQKIPIKLKQNILKAIKKTENELELLSVDSYATQLKPREWRIGFITTDLTETFGSFIYIKFNQCGKFQKWDATEFQRHYYLSNSLFRIKYREKRMSKKCYEFIEKDYLR